MFTIILNKLAVGIGTLSTMKYSILVDTEFEGSANCNGETQTPL